jgi:hypothetical protein
MPVIYNKISKPIKYNGFEFKFSFEHGDADSLEEYTIFHQNMTEEQLLAYVKKSNEISDMIDLSRSTGKPLPKNFKTQAHSNGFLIPVELDLYAKMHMSDYYAASGISEIFFYNEKGEKFSVQIID